MFALAGVGNTVYHPADYALLSHHVPAERIGQAFSIHTFAGMLGSAVAPRQPAADAEPVGLARRLRRRCRARLAVAAGVHGHGERSAKRRRRRRPRRGHDNVGWRLLLSPPILLNLVFLRDARADERRPVQLFGGGARRAVRHAARPPPTPRCPSICC